MVLVRHFHQVVLMVMFNIMMEAVVLLVVLPQAPAEGAVPLWKPSRGNEYCTKLLH